ncbi:hypothetical protein KHS38_12995 [Mucilaginibacter sp. Bleaf8]|uniref:S-4TM family putative pore-forming effector n=1 Tax=Mucilaginibacter sp. Bleaf8 TaxID=2834430 RepID=UPI001BD12E49|nr:S-4TM family putative pore-forming effector [Mucilaginibacter sp. Bleaf8]MBS7565323.1 hypothetical protein [Mucilaginibacter sp. Bleaf8]
MKNDILTRQNKPDALQRLAAQRELYSAAKGIFAWQALLTVILPVVLACFAIAFESWAPYIAWYGFIIFAIDLLAIDPQIKKLKTKAAKIQEMFDCGVLQLSYSELKTVSEITVETVLRYYKAHEKIATNIEKIKDWYPSAISEVGLPIARIICQRSSCWWDKKLREEYCQRIKYIIMGIFVLILSGCFFAKTETVHLILILSALVPFFQFAIKQYNDNIDMNCRLQQLSNYIEQVWRDILNGTVADPELKSESRRIQDGIYDNRTLSPLIFDFFYKKSRTDNELTMNEAAQKLVDEYNEAIANRNQ